MRYKGFKIPKWLVDLGFAKVPKFYKELGPEAVMAYLRCKQRKLSTKHWTLMFGKTKLVFWSVPIPVATVDNYLKKLTVYLADTGKELPDDPKDWQLEKWSINKPWHGLTYESISNQR